jgi:hypothetical protein
MLVLTLDGDAIAEFGSFIDPSLLPRFGLPAEPAHGTGAAR